MLLQSDYGNAPLLAVSKISPTESVPMIPHWQSAIPGDSSEGVSITFPRFYSVSRKNPVQDACRDIGAVRA